MTAAPTPAPPADRSVALRLAGTRFGWVTGQPDVLDIELLEVERGERVFIEGPSGSGKSSLLGLLGGVQVPRAGSVDVLGAALHQLGAAQRDRFRADHIGFVFQLFNLVPYLSMLDNVALPCRFSRRRREQAEANGGVMHEAERLVRALDLDVDEARSRSVTELSIGQQQRVAVARALIGAPEIVIADEPTSALDEGTRERFIALFIDECRAADTTVVFVSHDPRLAMYFDRRVSLAELARGCA